MTRRGLARWSGHRLRSLRTRDARGQALVLFVVGSTVFLGAAALATDVSWLFVSQQQMQRAADAAALAGSVYLPGNPGKAYSTAVAEASKNGFVDGTGGVDVVPTTDPGNPRRLIVDIDGAVRTYFARVFCWSGDVCLETVPLSVTGRAEYAMPVPMGSPQSYYGVGYLVDSVTTTSTNDETVSTTWRPEGGAVSGGQWSGPSNAASNNNTYATEDTSTHAQQWNTFGLLNLIPDEASTIIRGLELGLTDVYLTGSGTSTNCQLDVEVSWNGGTTWSSVVASGALSTTSTADKVLGSTSSTAVWGAHPWVRADFSDTNFRVRLTWRDGTASCGSSRTVNLDLLEARVTYSHDVTTTTTSVGPVDVISPTGTVLAPQNLWGAIQSQGAPNGQGDAYLSYYDTRTSLANDEYSSEQYYQYAVEVPAGASNGQVWLFDPGFCNVDSDKGTGEYWVVNGSNGYTPHQPISAFYDLYDTGNTPYDTSDDSLVATSGSQFRRLSMRDNQLDVSNPLTATDCSGEAWHNAWWQLASGLSGGHTYRLHSYTTDPASATDQRNSTGHNAFAIWSTATGGTPQVYGLGAMQAYVRLPGGQASEFYLAQIDAVHAGKTMVIRLWDAGDTGDLAASLQILRPTASSYAVTPFSYTATPSSSSASGCGSMSGQNVTSVTTNNGSSSLLNGCWLTIEIVMADDYSAPHPSTDTVTDEGGWWKIRYNMSGSASDNSTDMTTWQVELRGSPVHLVIS